MEGFIVFIVVCLTIGVLTRMAMGQTPGEATKNTFSTFSGPARTAGKIGLFGWKVYRRK